MSSEYPITGPRKIPANRPAITIPLWARGTKSAILPPATVIGAAPKQPATKRKTTSDAMFGARAQPIEQARDTMLEIL